MFDRFCWLNPWCSLIDSQFFIVFFLGQIMTSIHRNPHWWWWILGYPKSGCFSVGGCPKSWGYRQSSSISRWDFSWFFVLKSTIQLLGSTIFRDLCWSLLLTIVIGLKHVKTIITILTHVFPLDEASIFAPGRSSSLTAPNGPAQQEVILMAWQEAGLNPGRAFKNPVAWWLVGGLRGIVLPLI